MSERLIYLVSVVAIGWVVTFGLRALPFLIFAGKDREIPDWVRKLGRIISPVIIGGLIVYSYSGLEWRTVWPYLAGALTVGLQLWKRNPLASIIAGTVVYMCILNCGCVTKTISLDAQHPAVTVTSLGVRFGDEPVEIGEVPEILEDNDIPKTRTIHILLEPDVKDLRPARLLMATLARAGYTRPMLVTKRHAEAVSTGKKKKTYSASPSGRPAKPAPKRIRYKKAGE